MKRKRELADFVPPGARPARLLVWYFIALGIAVFITTLSQVSSGFMYDTLREYYEYLAEEGIQEETTSFILDDFAPTVVPYFTGFWGVALLCVAGIFVNRSAFYRDSKSIYLMKRLPTKGELFCRTAALPLLGLLLTLVTAVALLALYYFLYMEIIPPEHRNPDQLTRLFECLFDRAAYAARIRS